MLPVFFDADQSHNTPRCAEIQPLLQQAAAASLNMSISRALVMSPGMLRRDISLRFIIIIINNTYTHSSCSMLQTQY